MYENFIFFITSFFGKVWIFCKKSVILIVAVYIHTAYLNKFVRKTFNIFFGGSKKYEQKVCLPFL